MSNGIFKKSKHQDRFNPKSIVLKKIGIWTIAIVGTLAFSLAPLEQAYAASPFDSFIQTTDSLVVSNPYYDNQPHDITDTYVSIMQSTCPIEYAGFASALSNPDGKWAVALEHGAVDQDEYDAVNVMWSSDPLDHTEFYTSWYNNSYHYNISVEFDKSVFIQVTDNGIECSYGDSNAGRSLGGDNLSWSPKVFQSTYPTSYPSGYEGEEIPGVSAHATDTDNDGLSNLVESAQFPARKQVFCNSNGTTCAYPEQGEKDLYVEIDWMDDWFDDHKPTSTQLGIVEDGLDDNGYNVHIDTGQYGGGNEITNIEYLPMSPDASSTNFFDIKNGDSSQSMGANFNPIRKRVWRYLISGYGYDESHSSSGAAYAGSDNIFVSYGLVEDNPTSFGYSSFDTAIAGTMIHEIGHSLCLSKTQKYSYQSSDCRYNGVDTAVSNTYDSVMNYNLQMFQDHLSDGSNGSGDHDDWAAIDDNGIADFTQWDVSQIDFEPGIVHQGLTFEQAKKANKNGTLGKLKRNNKIYDFKENKVYDLKTNKVTDIKG